MPSPGPGAALPGGGASHPCRSRCGRRCSGATHRRARHLRQCCRHGVHHFLLVAVHRLGIALARQEALRANVFDVLSPTAGPKSVHPCLGWRLLMHHAHNGYPLKRVCLSELKIGESTGTASVCYDTNAVISAMVTIDIVVPDGAGPAALGLTLDALDTANRVAAYVGAERFDWRVLCVARSRAALRHGISIPAQPIRGARARDIVIVLGMGAAGPEEIDRRLAQVDVREAAAWLRSAHRRGE